MRLLIRAGALSLLVMGTSLSAQPAFFGQRFPLTNTRYGTARGRLPKLVSNGREPLLFWYDDQIRVARMINGTFGAARAALQSEGSDNTFDVVWTGDHFLVVADHRMGLTNMIVGRIVDGDGESRGEAFTILSQAIRPAIAFNGTSVLLLCVQAGTSGVSTLLLDRDGRPAEAAPRPLEATSLVTQRVVLASNGSTFAALAAGQDGTRLLFFNEQGQLKSNEVIEQKAHATAIATDGRRYLAVCACLEGGTCDAVNARLIEPDGTVGPPLDVGPIFEFGPAAAWTGSDWAIAYHSAASQPTLEVVRLDADARRVTAREERAGGGIAMLAIGGRTLAAWEVGRAFRDTILSADLPLNNNGEAAASFKATQQTVLATASTADATLVVWQEIGNERTTLHTGVRTRDGEWTERLIETVAFPNQYEPLLRVLAASDGREFMIAIFGTGNDRARRLNSRGEPVDRPVPMAPFFAPGDLFWNGTEYVLEGGDQLERLSPAGVLTPLQQLRNVGQSVTLATDRNGGYLAVWPVRFLTEFENTVLEIAGIRLGPDFQPLDAAPFVLPGGGMLPFTSAIAAWDGKQYVFAWMTDRAVMAARVAATGTAQPVVQTIAEERADSFDLIPVDGGTAVFWNTAASQRMTVLRPDGTTTPITTLATTRGPGLLAALPEGGVAFVDSVLQSAPPFESTSRITMTIGEPAPLPDRPEAPRVTATFDGVAVHLAWTAPPQPVSGYRVEYNVENSGWLEIATQLGRDELSLVRQLRYPTLKYVFRVRAWNDAGPGAYSDVLVVNGGRSRAVR